MKKATVAHLIRLLNSLQSRGRQDDLSHGIRAGLLGILLGGMWVEEALAAGLTAEQLVEKIAAKLTTAEKRTLVDNIQSVLNAQTAGTEVALATMDQLAAQLMPLAAEAGVSQDQLLGLLKDVGFSDVQLARLKPELEEVVIQERLNTPESIRAEEATQVAQGNAAPVAAAGEGVLPVAGLGGGGLLAGAGAVGVAAAAGGGGGGAGAAAAVTTPPPLPPPQQVATLNKTLSVIDGPLKGAQVFYDSNLDGIAQASEFLGETDENGAIQVQYTPVAGAKFIVVSDEDTVDTLTGNKFGTLLMADDNGQPGNQVASPLSTLIASGAISESLLKETLGLDPSIDLSTFNFIEALKGGNASASILSSAQKLSAAAVAFGNVIESSLNAAKALNPGLAGADINALTMKAFQSAAKALAKIEPGTSLADITGAVTKLAAASVLDDTFDVDAALNSLGGALSANSNIALPASIESLVNNISTGAAQTAGNLANLFTSITDLSSFNAVVGSGGALDNLEDASEDILNEGVNSFLGISLTKDVAQVLENQPEVVKGNLLLNDSGLPASVGVFSVNGTLVPSNVTGASANSGAVGNSYVLSTMGYTFDGSNISLPQMASFLGVSSSAISSSGFAGTAGSVIKQNVTVQAGDTLTFAYTFGSFDYLPFNDFGFFSIKDANGASPLDGAFKLVNVQDVKGPNPYADAGVFKTFTATMSYTFQQAGTFVVGVGVTDSIDQIFDSILTVQDFRINGNPLTGVAESAGTVQVNASAPVVEVSALVVLGDYGTLVVSKGGDYAYIPGGNHVTDDLAAGQQATDEFTYTIQMPDGKVASQKLSIDVIGTGAGVDTPPIANNDMAEATEDGAVVTGSVALNDFDLTPGPDGLSFALNAPVPGLVLNPDGSYSFDPSVAAYQFLAQGQTLTVSAPYTVSDGAGQSDTAQLLITLTGTNDAPTVVVDVNAASEGVGVAVTGNLASNDSDVDQGGSLSYALNSPVAGLTVNANGTYVFNPSVPAYNGLAAGQIQVIVASIAVTDNLGAASNSTLTITLTGTNDGPIAVADAVLVDENTNSLAGSVAANDSDPDNGESGLLTYALNNPVPGLTLNPDGTYVLNLGQPAYNSLAQGQTLQINASYTATDPQGATAVGALTITVSGQNDAPVALNDTNAAVEGTGVVTGNLAANDTDPDQGAVLTYSLAAPVAGLTVNPDGTYSFNPNIPQYNSLAQGQSITVSAFIKVIDEQGASPTVAVTGIELDSPIGNSILTITVTGTNDAPVAQVDIASLVEDVQDVVAISGNLLANDTDADNNPGIVLLNVEGQVPVAPQSANNYVLSTNYSPFTFSGVNASQAAIEQVLGLSGGALDQVAATSFNSGSNGGIDATVGSVMYTELTVQAGQTISFDYSFGSIDYLPFNDFAFVAIDGLGVMKLSNVTAIKGPLFYNQAYQYVESAPATFSYTFAQAGTYTVAIGVMNALDGVVDSKLTISALNVNAEFSTLGIVDLVGAVAAGEPEATVDGEFGFLTVLEDGSYTYTLTSNALGEGETAQETFTYTIKDAVGAVSTSTLTINLLGTNDGPVAVNDSNATNEGVAVIVGNLAVNDRDEDLSDTLTYTLNAPVAGLTVSSNGEYSFNPAVPEYNSLAQGQTLVIVAAYTVTDPEGASATANLTITLTGSNDAPVATVDAFSVLEDAGTLSGSVALNDTDPDAGDTAQLTYALNNPVAGLVLNTNGSFTLDLSLPQYQQLQQGQTLAVSASYTVKDPTGATSIANLTINVVGQNDLPVALNDQASATEGTGLLVGSLAVNDSDADQGAVLTYTFNTAVAGLAVQPNGSFTFNTNHPAYDALPQGQTMVLVAPYTVTDTAGATAQAMLTLTLTGSNDAPVAVADTNVAPEGMATIFGSVALNDSDADAGTTLTFSIANPVAGLVFNADGSYLFDPNNPAYDSVEGVLEVVVPYTVTDNFGATASSTLTIAVLAGNDLPVALPDVNAASEDAESITGSLAVNDTDPDGDELTYTLIEGFEGLTVNEDGSYVFNPASPAYQSLGVGQSLLLVATYQVQDPSGANDVSTLTISLVGTNDGPVASVVQAQAAEDGPSISGSLLDAVLDVDAEDTLTFNLLSPVDGLTVSPNGDYTFEANSPAYQSLSEGQTKTLVANYSVTDSAGAVSIATLTLVVVGTNDVPVAFADTNTTTVFDNIVSGSVALNDFDVDQGSQLTYSLAEEYPGLTLLPNGQYTLDLHNASIAVDEAGSPLPLVFEYTVTDQFGGASSSTLTISILLEPNTPPSVQDDTTEALESTGFFFGNLSENDSDVDEGDTLSYQLLNTVQGLTVFSDGSYQFNAFDPAFEYLAQGESLTLTGVIGVTDSKGAQSTSVFTIELLGTNDVPTVQFDSNSATESVSVITGDVSVNDADLDTSDVLTYSVVGQTPAGLVLNPDGTYTFDATVPEYESLSAGQQQLVQVTYEVTDSTGATAQSVLQITVVGTNDAPVAIEDNASIMEVPSFAASIFGNLLINDTDVDQFDALKVVQINGQSANFDGTNDFVLSTNSSVIGDSLGNSGAADQGAIESVLGLPFGALDSVMGTQTNGQTPVNATVGSVIYKQITVQAGQVFAFDYSFGSLDYLPFNDFGFVSIEGVGVFKLNNVEDIKGPLTGTLSGVFVQSLNQTFSHVFTEAGTFMVGLGVMNVGDSAVDSKLIIDNLNVSGPFEVLGIVQANADLNSGSQAVFVEGEYGFLTVFPDGSYQYTLSANTLPEGATAQEVFNYTVADPSGANSFSKLTIQIEGTNDAPVAVGDSTSVVEDAGILMGTVAANDIDVDAGAQLTYAALNLPAGFVMAPDGSYMFDPSAEAYSFLQVGQSTVVTVTYSVTDEFGASSFANLDITVTGTNDAPVAVADTNQIADFDGGIAKVSGGLLFNDSDPDSFPLKVVSVGGQQLIQAEPSKEYLLSTNYSPYGNSGFTAIDQSSIETVIGASSGSLDKVMGTSFFPNSQAGINATVGSVIYKTIEVQAGDTFSFDYAFGSLDYLPYNDFAFVSIEGIGVMKLSNITAIKGPIFFNKAYQYVESPIQQFSYEFAEAGTYTIAVGVMNALDGIVDSKLILKNFNVPTDFNSLGIVDITGESGTLGTQAFVTIEGEYGVLTVFEDGQYTYTLTDKTLPAGFTAQESFSYTVADPQGANSVSTLVIDVAGGNDTPVTVNDENAAVEGTEIITGSVAANDRDLDQNAVLRYELHSGVDGLIFNEDGSYVFDPAVAAYDYLKDGEALQIFLSYSVTDELGASAVGFLSIKVIGTNDVPVALAEVVENISEDAGVFSGNLQFNVLDPDHSSLDLSFTLNNAVEGFSLESNGSYTLDLSAYQDLAAGVTKNIVVSYTVTDPEGATAVSTLTLMVVGQNDQPIAKDDQNAVDEGTGIITGDLSANDTDIDEGDVLSYSLDFGPAGLVVNPDGTYSFDSSLPDYNYLPQGQTLELTAQYSVQDGNGGQVAALLKITLTGTNDAPTAQVVMENITEAVDAGASTLGGNVLSSAAPLDPDAGDVVKVVSVDGQLLAPPPVSAGFLLSTNYASNGAFSGFSSTGQSSLEVFLGLGEGALDNVLGTNPPGFGSSADATVGSAVYKTITVQAGQTLSFDYSFGSVDYLPYNDFAFVSINGLGVTKLSSVQDIKGPVFFNQAGSYVQSAIQTYTYTFAQAGEYTIGIGVMNAYDGVVDSKLFLDNLKMGGLPLADFQQTGIVEKTGADNTEMAQATIEGLYGTLVIYENGTYTYALTNQSLAEGETAQEVFDYTIADPSGATSSSTITFNLLGTNDTPIAVNDQNAAVEGGAVISGSVAANDRDLDQGDSLTYTPVFSVVSGFVLNQDGTYTFDPTGPEYDYLAVGQSTEIYAHYQVQDAQGAVNFAVLTIKLTGTNDAPVAVADEVFALEDTAQVIHVSSLLGNDFDVDSGDTFTFEGVGNAVNGMVVYDAETGNITFTPSFNFFGEAFFDYTIKDIHGAVSTATVTVKVADAADSQLAPDDSSVVEDLQPLTTGNLLANDDLVAGSKIKVGDQVLEPAISNQFVLSTGSDLPNDFSNEALSEVLASQFLLSMLQLETLAGLQAGELSGLVTFNGEEGSGTAPSFEGSALRSTVAVTAGASFSFDYQFVSAESGVNDFAYVTIVGPNGFKLIQVLDQSANLPNFNQNAGEDGLVFYERGEPGNFTFVFEEAGEYTITLGVVDVDDAFVASQLLINNFVSPASIEAFGAVVPNAVAIDELAQVQGQYGVLYIQPDGGYLYVLANNLAQVDALNDGETLTDVFSYSVLAPDGTVQSSILSVIINGTTDVQFVISEAAAADLIADGFKYAPAANVLLQVDGETVSDNGLTLANLAELGVDVIQGAEGGTGDIDIELGMIDPDQELFPTFETEGQVTAGLGLESEGTTLAGSKTALAGLASLGVDSIALTDGGNFVLGEAGAATLLEVGLTFADDFTSVDEDGEEQTLATNAVLFADGTTLADKGLSLVALQSLGIDTVVASAMGDAQLSVELGEGFTLDAVQEDGVEFFSNTDVTLGLSAAATEFGNSSKLGALAALGIDGLALADGGTLGVSVAEAINVQNADLVFESDFVTAIDGDEVTTLTSVVLNADGTSLADTPLTLKALAALGVDVLQGLEGETLSVDVGAISISEFAGSSIPTFAENVLGNVQVDDDFIASFGSNEAAAEFFDTLGADSGTIKVGDSDADLSTILSKLENINDGKTAFDDVEAGDLAEAFDDAGIRELVYDTDNPLTDMGTERLEALAAADKLRAETDKTLAELGDLDASEAAAEVNTLGIDGVKMTVKAGIEFTGDELADAEALDELLSKFDADSSGAVEAGEALFAENAKITLAVDTSDLALTGDQLENLINLGVDSLVNQDGTKVDIIGKTGDQEDIFGNNN